MYHTSKLSTKIVVVFLGLVASCLLVRNATAQSDTCPDDRRENRECWVLIDNGNGVQEKFWRTKWFSEEGKKEGKNTAWCPTGTALRGIECSGRYCDNVRLYCYQFSFLDVTGRSDWFSEEDFGYHYTGNPITQMWCDKRYCDNVQLQYSTINVNFPLPPLPDGNEFPSLYIYRISEEPPARVICPTYIVEQKYSVVYYMYGIRCEGSYCDNLEPLCMPVMITGIQTK